MKELKALEDLKKLKEYLESENVLGDLDYTHYSVMIDYIDEAIAELEALGNRSCMNCKHNEITICKKLPSIDWSFEQTSDFDCRKWESI